MSINVTEGGTTPSLSELVAEEIRALLGRRRMSQASLARQLKVSPMWVNYRLTGTQPIDLNDLERIATTLGVTVFDLLPREPEGRMVTTAGSASRQHTGPKIPVPERPARTGHPGHRTPDSSTRRPARIAPGHAYSLDGQPMRRRDHR